MRYGLDISEVELPEWWPQGGPNIISIKRGALEYDWDVCKSQLPRQFYTELVAALRTKSPNGIEPPGFNGDRLPKGAKIITITEPQ